MSQFGQLNLSATGTDETNLTMAWLATNETGEWINWSNGMPNPYGSPINITTNPVTGANITNFTWSNSTLAGNTTIQWKIYYNDSSGNINETGVMNFSLLPTISISLINSTVEFGTLVQGISNYTTSDGGLPMPFVIVNDGNWYANLTIEATSMFPESNPNPTQFYMFNSSLNKTGSVYNTATDLVNPFTNISAVGNPVKLATNMNWTNISDEIRVHINITIPFNASAGTKNSTVTFTASQAR